MNITTARKKLKYTKQDDLIKIISKLSGFSEQADLWLNTYCDQNSEKDRLADLEKQITAKWEDIQYTVALVNRYGGCEEAKIEKAYRELERIPVLAAKGPVSWRFRKNLIDEILDHYSPNEIEFDNSIYECAYDLCYEKEEKLYFAEKSKDDLLAARIYKNYGENDQYAKLLRQNLSSVYDYLELAQYFLQLGQTKEGIRILEEALEKASVSYIGDMDEVYSWLFNEYREKKQEKKILQLYDKACAIGRDVDTMAELMYSYYINDYEKRKKYLFQLLEICDSSNLHMWFEECQEQLTPEDLRANSDYLHKVLKDRDLIGYLKLRIEEGEYQEVYEYLKNNRDVIHNDVVRHDLEKKVAKAYPKEVIDWFWEECESYSKLGGIRDIYIKAVRILVEIKSLSKRYGFTEDWESRYQAYLENHAKQRTLNQLIREEKRL